MHQRSERSEREKAIWNLVEGEKKRLRKKIEKTRGKLEELLTLKYYSNAINQEI